MNKKRIISIIKLGLGIIILVVLFYKLGFSESLNTLKNINLFFVSIFLIFFLLNLFAFYLNIYVLLIKFNKHFSFLSLLRYVLLAWAAGMVLPGKLGEFSLVYFLRKYEIEIGESSSILVLDKIITLIITSMIAIFGFFIFLNIKQAMYLVVFILILFVLLFVFIITNFGRKLIKKYILRKRQIVFRKFSKTFFEYFRHHKKLLVINSLVTIIRIIFGGLMINFIFNSLGINVSLLLIILIFSMTSIVSLIPITISGLGIKQSFGAYLYGSMGVPKEIIGGIYIIILILNYGLSFIIFMTLNKKDIKIK